MRRSGGQVGTSTAVLNTFSESALSSRACLVTGAASGMGRATALRFAEAGADLAVADVQDAALADTVAMIEKATGRIPASVVVDLARDDGGLRAVEAAIGAYGRLDAVANCAGVGGFPGTVEVTPPDQWDRILATNLRSMYAVCAAAVPHLRAAGGGAIVNWSSGAAYRTDRRATSHSYAASKGAITSLTTAMAVSFGRDRIRVNAIVPGLIDTPMTASLVGGAHTASAEDRGLPIGRVGVPDDVAGCALFLVSDAASFISGTVIFIDGAEDKQAHWSDWLA